MNLPVLHCTGCHETFEGSERLIGALCGHGKVRLATAEEIRLEYFEVPEQYETEE